MYAVKYKRKVGRLTAVILTLLAAAAVCGYIVFHRTNTMAFQKTDDAVKSPYSGAYIQAGISASVREWLPEYFETHDDLSIWFMTCDLRQQAGEANLSQETLDDLEASLSLAQDMGVGVIFRAAYDFDGNYTDPDEKIILAHIGQIAPVLNAHKVVLLGVQAGMIGPWGEWHSSAYTDEGDDSLQQRMEILQRWLDTLDDDIYVSLRKQSYIREAAAYGLDTARLGIYNDGLFASDSDLGTYTGEYDREAELNWSEKNISVPFNGGEMPYVTEFSDIDNVVREAGMLNLSYLNLKYNTAVWEQWESQQYDGMSGSAYLLKYLGSRLSAETLETSSHMERRRCISVKLSLANDGFAVVDSSLKVYFILEYGDERSVQEAQLNMKDKGSGCVTAKLENPFRRGLLTDSDNEDSLRLGVMIARSADAPEAYCIRLANDGIEYEEGINWLLT